MDRPETVWKADKKRFSWGVGLLVTFSAATGLARPAWVEPPVRASLVRIEGDRTLEDRLLLLPVETTGGLRFARRSLDLLFPTLSDDLLRAFFLRESEEDTPVPPGVRSASFHFGEGGGAFRLQGTFSGNEVERYWEEQGLRWGPQGGYGRTLEGEDVWGWQQENLLYGGWGLRAEQVWMGELNGRGRRLYSLKSSPRQEALSIWAQGSLVRRADVQALSGLPESSLPGTLGRVEVSLRCPSRDSAQYRWKVRLIPKDPRLLEELGDWLRMLWNTSELAQVRKLGPAIELLWEESPRFTRLRLETWSQLFLRWMRGDAYRSLL